jgi:hypothetical protein
MEPWTYQTMTGGWWGTPWPGVVQAAPTDPPPQQAPLGKSVMAGGTWAEGYSHLPAWTASPVELAFARYGHRLWDMMLVEAKVKGSVALLKGSILADGICVRAAYRSRPLKGPDGSPQQTGADPSDEQQAERIAQFCGRCIQRLMDRTPLEQVADELLDGTIHGSMLAEDVLREVDRGVDKGKLVLQEMLVRPRVAWADVVDRQGRAVGVEVVTPEGPSARYRPDKFTIFRWGTRNGNPQGTHLLDAAYMPWNAKIQLYPRYNKFLYRFAEPSLVGTAGENAQPRIPRDADGLEIAGAAPISAVQDLAEEMDKFQGGSVLAAPYGTVIQALETHGTGESFLQAFDYFDREIVFAVLWQIRATLEAKHGSKADSETAEGILGNATIQGRRALARCIRQPFRLLVRLNYGDEAADLYTPEVSLGDLDDDELIRLSNAVAKLCESGYLAESQLPEIDRRLKLPVRLPGSPRVTSAPAAQGPEGSKGGQPAQKGKGPPKATPSGGPTSEPAAKPKPKPGSPP